MMTRMNTALALLVLVGMWLVPAVAAGQEVGTPLGTPVSVVSARGSTAEADARATPFSLRELDLHPDFVFQPYVSGPLLAETGSAAGKTISSFRRLLDLYATRQGTDDNFTVRVMDKRTHETLEVFVLKAERARYEREGTADWQSIDRKRRQETRRLLDKYERRGYPRSVLAARWGRRNQVMEARRNELPYIDYEIRLARYLGLSLLATEIGTVETFNQDHLVSPAGARGRYQLMPFLLRHHGLARYHLTTVSGRRVVVAEEWHPLLTMEPAFLTLRGYINAVGHEIPGISAYHAGPGNIFKLYRDFLDRGYTPASTVVDAFIWGLTDGFPVVSEGSSFGSYSRGYVPAVYGSLRALENDPIDPAQTLLAERVQLRRGAKIPLSRLLMALDANRAHLQLRSAEDPDVDLYDLFSTMNPHMALPEGEGDGVPVVGDLLLVSHVQGKPVRFFLPLGASRVLELAGVDVLDAAATVRYDDNTYADPISEKTTWDWEYEELVRDVQHFGFTTENRRRLRALVERFEALARARPSPYRLRQLEVIKTHERIWDAPVWEKLAEAVEEAVDRHGEPLRLVTTPATAPASDTVPERRVSW